MKKVFLFAAMLAMALVSCTDDNGTNNGSTNNDKDKPSDSFAGITIDGNFSDWEELKRSNTVFALNDSDSAWDAVEEIRVWADDNNIYYYVLFDRDVIADYLAGKDTLPCRLNLNTDNEFESGYSNYFLQAYDFIIEGNLGDGLGDWGFFDGKLYQRIGSDWVMLMDEKNGLTIGAGGGVEYEIALDREMFNEGAAKSSVPMPLQNVIQTSMRFYETSTTGKWVELSNMPNSSIDDGKYGDLLEVNI